MNKIADIMVQMFKIKGTTVSIVFMRSPPIHCLMITSSLQMFKINGTTVIIVFMRSPHLLSRDHLQFTQITD